MAKVKKVRWYKVVIECNNCGEREIWEVKVGGTVAEAIRGKSCPRCELFWESVGWRRVSGEVV